MRHFGGERHTLCSARLVRPDGHIGYLCGGTDLGGVERYLARWFPRRLTGIRPPESRRAHDEPQIAGCVVGCG
jgi:hypothetical protein